MSWTNEQLTQRGWYWFRGTLRQYDGIVVIDDCGQARLSGHPGWWTFAHFEGEWAGPLEPSA